MYTGNKKKKKNKMIDRYVPIPTLFRSHLSWGTLPDLPCKRARSVGFGCVFIIPFQFEPLNEVVKIPGEIFQDQNDFLKSSKQWG